MSSRTPTPEPSPFRLPGFGLPLNYIPGGKTSTLFRNALNSVELYLGRVQQPLTTLREFSMLRFMNSITDKPDWHVKVFDELIIAKWKEEMGVGDGTENVEQEDGVDTADEGNAAEEASGTGHDDEGEEQEPAVIEPGYKETESPAGFSNAMFAWCIAELQYKAKIFEKTGIITAYNGDVVKSDVAIPHSLQQALKQAVLPLEQIPEREKDWHPDSDNMVLDLVHPSLFPLIYGQSRILEDSFAGLEDCVKRCGEGKVVPIPPDEKTALESRGTYFERFAKGLKNPFSKQFQWLPCEVDISGGEGNIKITSYINNLHPGRHGDLYAVVEQLISHTIPLWNTTLAPLKGPDFCFDRVIYSECKYDPDPESWDEEAWPQMGEDEDEDEYYERRDQWFEDTRVVVQPEPGTFRPPSVPKDGEHEYYIEGTQELKPEKTVDIYRDYRERGLQVIVKLANIHLTPDKPGYEGGTWHVEGQLNEHICASAIYYYDSENITTSRLAFRQQSNTDINSKVNYLQSHHDWLPIVFGCENESVAVQDIGSVDTPEGRLLTWPNVLQHQVQPFQLEDPTKPGHRKIVALFLVDPNIRIISTANVPCQQREWWWEVIQRDNSAIPKLPAELQDLVFESVSDFPISLEEAKRLRVKLMDERKKYVVQQGEAFKQHEFSLCEH